MAISRMRFFASWLRTLCQAHLARVIVRVREERVPFPCRSAASFEVVDTELSKSVTAMIRTAVHAYLHVLSFHDTRVWLGFHEPVCHEVSQAERAIHGVVKEGVQAATRSRDRVAYLTADRRPGRTYRMTSLTWSMQPYKYADGMLTLMNSHEMNSYTLICTPEDDD
jgi:hypothetical protein